VQNQVGVQRLAGHDDADRTSTPTDHILGAADPEGDVGLGLGRGAQCAFQRDAPAVQADSGAPHHGGGRARREQRLMHVRHFGIQRVDALLTERMWLVELHHPAALPDGPIRAAVAVDHRYPVPTAGECDSKVQTGRTGADHGNMFHVRYDGAAKVRVHRGGALNTATTVGRGDVFMIESLGTA
jgi:hypothetical protein